MPPALLETPLHAWHAAHGGRLVDFAGWSMPVLYASIVAEHRATRGAAGVFDISHMGRLRFDGPGATGFLDSLLTRRVDNLAPQRIRYSLVTNDAGGTLDDVLVYRLAESDGRDYFLLVVNAGNRTKIVDWIKRHLAAAKGAAAKGAAGDVSMSDLTFQTAMIAVQGPAALASLRSLVSVELSAMKYYSALHSALGTTAGLVSRTGYTGEDGVEWIVPAADALAVWEAILDAGQAAGVVPVGLGARDTLRLEAGMPLYGHELTEEINPLQAGLDFAVDLGGRRFPGSAALAAAKDDQNRSRRVGLLCAAGRVPREGCEVLFEEENVGHVTSGTFSPTLDAPIAMAYVAPRVAAVGTELSIDVRGNRLGARVVTLPFYRR